MNTNREIAPPVAEASVALARDFGIWLHERTNGLDLPADTDRLRVSQALFHLSLEHYDAIVILLSHRAIGSAFALARPLVESCVRAKWILSAATEQDVRKFVEKKKLDYKFIELLDQIGNARETGGLFLHSFKQCNWAFLNDLTHGGMQQVIRRATDSSIESLYPIDEQENLLLLAAEIAIMIAAELFLLANIEQWMVELSSQADRVRRTFKTS